MSPGIEISKRLVLVNSASTVIRSVLSLTVLIWVQAYLVNAVDAEEYKTMIVYQLLLFVPLLTMVVGGGVGRFVIEAYAKGDTRRVTQITSTLFPITIVVGLLVALIGGMLTWKIRAVLNLEPQYEDDARIMFGILVGLAALRAMLIPFTVGMNVKQKYLFLNVFGLCLEVLRIVLLFALLYGVSARVIWLVVATVPGSLIDLAVNVAYSRRLVPSLRFDRREIRPALIRPIMNFGGWTLVSRASAIAREMSAGLFLTHYSSAANYQMYRLGAYVESRFYPTILGPLLTLQAPLTGMHALGQVDRLKRTYFRVARYVLWGFSLFAVPGMIFHREIWEVWLGHQAATNLAGGSLVFVLLLAKTFFVFPQPALAQVALAKAKHGPMALRSLVIEWGTVFVTLYVVRQMGYGAVGLAVASFLICAVGTPILHWRYGLKLTDARFGEFARETVAPGMLPALAATPVWAAAWYLVDATVWWKLLGASGIGGLVFAFVLLRFCLNEHERKDLERVKHKVRKTLRAA